MIEKFGHYSLENTASIYDEEAMTALELAGRTAQKVNECIDTVNEADEYLRKNLVKTVDDNIQAMAQDGTLETKLVQAVSSGKVDKGANETITYDMLAQDVKEAMTGGNTPVVGTNAVNTTNIVDGSVTAEKLANIFHRPIIHTGVDNYNKPFLRINTTAGTAEVNSEVTSTIAIYHEGVRHNFKLSDVSIDISTYFTAGNTSFSLFMDLATNVIYVVRDLYKASEHANKIFLGVINNTKKVCDFVIPIEIDGIFYNGQDAVDSKKIPRSVGVSTLSLHRYHGDPDNVVFNIDTATMTASTVKGGTYNVYTGISYAELNLDTVTYDMTGMTNATVANVYYDSDKNRILFLGVPDNIPAHFIYLGLINLGNVHTSTCAVPFSVDNTYLYFPTGDVRRSAHILYYPRNYQTETKPYVDFVNSKLVFPSVLKLGICTSNQLFEFINRSTPEDYVVDLVTTGANFIVGNKTGIKAIPYAEFINLMNGTKEDQYFYIGEIYNSNRQMCMPMEVLHGSTLSVIGDSISTLEGYIPADNPAHYANELPEMMWWGHVCRACGMQRNVINAYSGGCVSNVRDNTNNGMEFAKHLDNGTAPDNIIIYLGINDFVSGVPLGTYNGKGPIPSARNTFREAYAQMLNNAMTTYPNAKIYACTLPAMERNSSEIGIPESNTAGVYLSDYNEAIRELATNLHIEVIDLATCAINYKNGSVYMHDYESATGKFLHPNSKGHKAIADKVIKTIR